MGNELTKKPGGSTLQQPDVSGPTGIPGKTTQVQQQQGQKPAPPASSAADIGDAWIENREHCTNGSDQGCFLTDVQRDRLVTETKLSIRQSETFFVQALTEIGFARLIQKEEELPAIIALALDIASGYLSGLAVKAMKALRSTPTWNFHKTVDSMLSFQSGDDTGPSPSLVRNVLNVASPEGLEEVIKAAMDSGKKKIEGAGKKKVEDDMTNQAGLDASNRKEVTLNYLDELKISASVSYESLSRSAPGIANDAERIALFKSFTAANGHHVPGFKAALEQKLARYLSSPASEIGRNKHRMKDGANPKDSYNATIRDTEVAWVVVSGDPVPKLYYMRQDWANNAGSADGVGDPSYLDGSPNERGVPDHLGQSQQGRLTLMRPVEPEFQSTALARQQQVWGRPPTTRQRTREELAAETGDYSILARPRLDLTPKKAPPPAAPTTPAATPAPVSNNPFFNGGNT